MITDYLIPDKLMTFDYYRLKLPLYLRQSKTFQEHFRIWYDLLIGNEKKGLVGNARIFFNLLQLFDKDYITFLNSLKTDEEDESKILDYIGDLFGVYRNNSVTYSYNDETKTEDITLSDAEFLTLIKAKIVKNNYDGTRSQLQDYYDIVAYKSIYFDNVSADATLNVFMVVDTLPTIDTLTNTQKMFLSGAFNIESLGIAYTNSLRTTVQLSWDTEGIYWDEGAWSE